MRVILLGAVLAGCGFSGNPALPGDDAPPDDASGMELAPDDTLPCATYSTLFDSCTQTPAATMPITVPSGASTYNTTTGVLTIGGVTSSPPRLVVDGAAGPIDIVFFRSFELAAGANLRVFGMRALLIASAASVQIDGTIDSIGPGTGSRTDAICGPSVGTKGSNSNSGAGGGGGGAFQGAGGGGSQGNLDGQPVAGGPGGTAIARPASPIGGCDGGDGGQATGAGGTAGDGGGAIAIASGMSITIGATGVINVGGSGGGGGGANDRGGGGGGSGGMILLEANQVRVTGVLAANGGGGGEGSNGMRGQDGQPSAIAANGGAGQDGGGGDGGAGGAGATLAGVTTIDRRNGGGGGGGGGVGFIAIRGTAMTAQGTISPAFAAWP